MNFRYGACVGSWDRVEQWITPALQRAGGREFIGLDRQPGLALAYNALLDRFAADGDGPVILLHDDLEILDVADAEAKANAVFDGLGGDSVAIVGVCGGVSDVSLAWWAGPTLGHQYVNDADGGRMLLDFGDRTGDAGVLEGSFLAFSPWAVRNLRYDVRYPGFHCADEVCLTARQAGKRLVVADIDTHHHTQLGFKSEAAAANWATGEALYQQKRSGR